MFCVECGKEGKTYEGLCEECYLSRRQFVQLPDYLDVQVCGSCYSVKIGNRWRDALSLQEAIVQSLISSVVKDRKVRTFDLNLTELIERDPRNYLAIINVRFTVNDLACGKDFEVQIRLKKDTCKRCGRKSGHYYEAIIQIRGAGKEPEQESIRSAREHVSDSVKRMGMQNREIFISKIEAIHGGFDFYISSSSAAKSIARELTKMFGAGLKTSASVAGMKDGQELRRTTYLIRLPEYEVGDILEIDGRYYLLHSVADKMLNIADLTNWQESSVSTGQSRGIRVLKRSEHVRDATVVSESEHEVQILDPETLTTIDVRKPSSANIGASTIPIIKTSAGIFILPKNRSSSRQSEKFRKEKH